MLKPLPASRVRAFYDNKVFRLPNQAGLKPDIKRNKFDPIPQQLMSSMMYFAAKYKNDCVVMPFDTKKRLGDPYSHHLITILWNERKQKLHFPKKFYEALSKCHGKKRFVIFPLTIMWKDGELHSNYMIYDSKHKSLERFESYGVLDTPGLDDALKKVVGFGKPGSSVKIYYDPPLFLPNESFQAIQENDKSGKMPTNVVGYCMAWSDFYADLRLSNPDIPPKKLTKLALKTIQKSNKPFVKFIQSYADFYHEIRVLLLATKPKNWDSVLKSLANASQ